MQLLSVAGPSVSARSGTFTLLFQCALRRTSPGFSRQGVGFEGGSKNLETQGETVSSDRLKSGLHTQELLALGGSENSPSAAGEAVQFEVSNSHPDEPHGRVADGCGHAADLAVLPFGQLQANPTGRHGLAEADRRVTWGNIRLRVENPGAAGQRLAFLNDKSFRQLEQGIWRGNSLDLDPVFAFVGVARVQQSFIQTGLVAEQEQTFGVGIEPAYGIDALGEAEFGQGAIGGTIGREPGENAVGFVEGDKHLQD